MARSNHDFRAHPAAISRSDQIDAARKRSFDVLGVEEVAPTRRLSMHDPQQTSASHGSDEATLVVPGSERMTVLVEPVAFESLETLREPDALADTSIEHDAVATPAPPDPAAIARQVIAEARETARTMLRQARDVIAADRAQALEQARVEGYAAGRAEADAEMAGLVETCERIGVHVMQERERVLAANEADIVELAIAVARRIVNASLDVDETLVIDACRGAMRKAFQRGSMQVLAHPDDLELLRAAGPKLADELGGVDHLDFVAERRLDRGSIVVRTPAGEIDATIDGKASKIELALREGIEHRRAARRGNET